MANEGVFSDLLSPALSRQNYGTTRTGRRSLRVTNPLPWRQLSIVLFVWTCHAMSALSIQAYISQLVGGLDVVGGNEAKVGYFVGLIESFYQASMMLTTLHWNRLSDHIGRKPILLLGIFSSMSSMISFGLSQTIWKLIASRCILGLFDGNIGIIRCIVGEITDATNRARAFALTEVLWAVGGSIGPVIAGTLSKPADSFLTFENKFWIRHPYFLPNFVISIIIGVAFFVVLFFFQETLTFKSHKSHVSLPEEGISFPSSTSMDIPELLPMRKVLTRPVIIAASNYTALAVLGSCHESLFSIFAAMPIDIGGLGFDPESIGFVLGLHQISTAVFLATLFPPLVSWLGERRGFFGGILSTLFVWALYPIINICARWWGVGRAVWTGLVAMGMLVATKNLAHGCVYVFITSAAPNQRSLGATNGIALMIASMARTIGTAMATSLFSLSVERNLLGGYAVYFVMSALSCGAVWLSTQLPHDVRPSWETNDDD